jgi:hypothetical protein
VGILATVVAENLMPEAVDLGDPRVELLTPDVHGELAALDRAHQAARGLALLDDQRHDAGFHELVGGGETGRTGADDQGVDPTVGEPGDVCLRS